MFLGNAYFFFYNNCYIIIFYLGPTFIYLTFYFLSSARTAPETGHSRLIDPGHKPHKGKDKKQTFSEPVVVVVGIHSYTLVRNQCVHGLN